MPKKFKASERVAKLEQAIRHSNGWLEIGEGVDLLYYYNEAYGEEQSRELIESIIRRPGRR